jgi:intraflagellar transport protein 56
LKAFEILERLNDEEDYFNQKLGACIGVFKNLLLNKNSQEELEEAVEILRAMPNELAVEKALQIMENYLPED